MNELFFFLLIISRSNKWTTFDVIVSAFFLYIYKLL